MKICLTPGVRLLALTLTLLFGGTLHNYAQQISGKITDVQKDPIPGATLMVEGHADVGTITDIDGNYSLNVPDGTGNILIVSFIGMETQRILLDGKRVVNVVLKESYTALNEVVSIGYGNVKRKDLTGAVASVKTEALKETPVSNVAEALQGRLPGVAISTQDGRPGAEVKIRIRGGGSITQSNDPLIVIDGVPNAGSLSDIPASQIESIDVLKDASSTAIYGARGANGVILVTTKGLNTQKGKVNVSYSGYYQMKQLAKTLTPLSAQEYILHQWSYGTAYGNSADLAMQGLFGLGSENGNKYAAYADVQAHDYTQDLIRDSYQHDHNLSVSSNSDKTIFSLNLNVNDDQGIKIKSGIQRQQAAVKVQQQLSDKVKMGIDIRYLQSQQEGNESVRGGKGSILSSAYMFTPIDTPLGEGEFSDYSGWGNGDVNLDPTYDPYAQTLRIENFTNRQKLNGMLYFDWEIIRGLKAHYEIAGNRNYCENLYYNEEVSSILKTATVSNSSGKGWRSSATVNYEVQGLNDHALSFLAGTDAQYARTNRNRMYGRGYPEFYDFERTIGMIHDANIYKVTNVYDPANPEPAPPLATIHEITKENFDFSNTIGVESTTFSLFGRVNYAFKDRYLFTASIRADESSNFAPNNRWGYFPAAAAAWRISEEPFMESTNGWLDNLKLRLTYGESGMDRIPYYAWNDLFDISYANNGKKIIENKGTMPNPDLKWETTVSRNIGVDMNVLNSRVNVNLDLYSNYTKDLLGQVPQSPDQTGYDNEFQNIGRTSNHGVEVGVSVDVVRRQDFTFSVSGTYNYNQSNIDELDDQFLTDYSSGWAGSIRQPQNEFLFEKGKPVGTIRAYVSEKFYTPDDFNYTVDEATGDYTYTLKEGIPYYSMQITNNYPNPFSGKVQAYDYEKDADGNYLYNEQGQPIKRTDENGNPLFVTLYDVFPGALKIKDANGDHFINEDDVTELGQTTPKHTGGFALSATWKGFDMNANFVYALGGKVLNVNNALNGSAGKDYTLGANRLDVVRDAYKVYQVNAAGNLVPVTSPDDLNALNAEAQTHLPYYEMNVLLSHYIEKNDFLRLNTLTLGYTLPGALTQKVAIERVRFYVTGGNLFVLSNYTGLDPEVSTRETSGSYPTPGLDFGSYPRSRTFTFGVNVDF